MGVYMSKPVKDKESSDLDGKLLKCGASSMQGWRVSQEDAHNCCVEFDEDISLFAVYDGHGGHEVAEYASTHLPNVIKQNESYKTGDYQKALIDSFLDFDATLKTEAVIAELQKIAKEGKKSKDGAGGDCGESDDEEDEETAVAKLREEANMPLAEVIAMYANGTLPKTPRNKLLGGPSKPMSPFLRAARCCGSSSKDSEVSSSSSGPSSSLTNGSSEGSSTSSKSEPEASEAPKATEPESSKPDQSKAPEPSTESPGGGSGNCSSSAPEVTSSSTNGEVAPSSTTQEEPSASSSSPKKSRRDPAVSSGEKDLTSSLLDSTFASDDEEDSDNEFQANEDGASSSDEDADVSHLNGSKESEEDEEDEEDDEEEVEDESEEDEEDEDEEDGSEFIDMKGGPEEPGMDSGCTAVVALVTKDKLFVANAGDSRAVLSRNGTAVDLSVDHKPEDAIELKRIQNAGGKVTNDGRVNGGLNLSRALGDHFYKRSADLDAREQMITALPDVVVETLDRSTDEFIVLACDGIWNSMSSQEVVDFVRPLVQNGETLSSICEKLFEACLAPDTLGDGTGCDNMTCVIVKLLPLEAASEASNKRSSPDPEENDSSHQPETKKPKLSTES
uniref:protein-serine/threonine phosphatase n=1 Tax=Lygus hesperus TaxID=30085 RepID=A0A146KPM3_LYGHE